MAEVTGGDLKRENAGVFGLSPGLPAVSGAQLLGVGISLVHQGNCAQDQSQHQRLVRRT
ncbi:hypothetical protein [Shimia haliotis]|uniref:hypothetical protein n=1 Tax=Shimia haliotis TaxID=1280847 RepID=UPI00147B7131|nr:hypothetical protein [Shimia haliotis]